AAMPVESRRKRSRVLTPARSDFGRVVVSTRLLETNRPSARKIGTSEPPRFSGATVRTWSGAGLAPETAELQEWEGREFRRLRKRGEAKVGVRRVPAWARHPAPTFPLM